MLANAEPLETPVGRGRPPLSIDALVVEESARPIRNLWSRGILKARIKNIRAWSPSPVGRGIEGARLFLKEAIFGEGCHLPQEQWAQEA